MTEDGGGGSWSSPVAQASNGGDGGDVTLEGWIRKRSRRYGTSKQWNERYFVLRGPVLSYYVRRADVEAKGEFVLAPNCIVSDIYVEGKDKKHGGGSSSAANASLQGEASLTAASQQSTKKSLHSPKIPFSRAAYSRSGASANGAGTPTGTSKKDGKKEKKDSKRHYCIKISWPKDGHTSSTASDDERSSVRSSSPEATEVGGSADNDDHVLNDRDANALASSVSFQEEHDSPPTTPCIVRKSYSEECSELAASTPAPLLDDFVVEESPAARQALHHRRIASDTNLERHHRQRRDGQRGREDGNAAVVPFAARDFSRPSHHRGATQGSISELALAVAASQKKQTRRKTKKMIVQGSKVAVAAGAAVTATVLTAGVGLAAGLTFVAISAAAGGSGAVASRTYIRSRKNAGTTLVLSTASIEEAVRWRSALERAVASLSLREEEENTTERSVEESTWASLFAMDGHNPTNALIPTGRAIPGSAAASATGVRGGEALDAMNGSETDVGGGSNQVGKAAPDGKLGLCAHHSTRWRPVEGGWATLLGMGASGLRIYEEEAPSQPRTVGYREEKMSSWRTTPFNINLSVKGPPCPPLKGQVILDATPINAFMCLMSHNRAGRQGSVDFDDVELTPGSYQRASFRIVETIDDHMDIIHLVFRPLYLFPSWTAPRDYCLSRYWRFEDDGSYIVCYDSVTHRECPPTQSYVRGELHGVYTIAPLKMGGSRRRKHRTTCRAHPQCLLTQIVQVDPRGWVPCRKLPMLANQSYAEAFAVSSLLQILDVRDALTNDRFVNVTFADDQSYNRTDIKKLIDSCGGDQLVSAILPTESEDEDRLALIQSADSVDENADKVNYDYSYSNLEMRNFNETERSIHLVPSAGDDLPSPRKKLIHCVPEPLVRTQWAEPDANSFMVRGKTYLSDNKKIHAGKSLFRLIALDIFEVSALIKKSMCAHPKDRFQQALAREREFGPHGDMPPFIFCVNITLPGPPHHHIVVYYAVDDMALIDGSNGTPSSRLCKEFFFGDSDEFRDKTFKLIPQIVDGNFIVRKAVGSTPAIMGTKLKQYYYSGERFFELFLDVGSSSVAAGVVRLCIGYAKTLVVDMAFLLEGTDETTLPEKLLGCARLKNVDFSADMRFVDQYGDMDESD